MTDILLIMGWCFAASLVLPLFTWALMPLLPRCAATRHLVWLALFAVLLVLPLLALAVPPQLVLHQTVEAAVTVATPAPRGWSMTDAVPLLILAWLLGAGFHLARLALGLFGLHRLRRDSVAFDGAPDVRLADDGPLAFGVIRPLILLPHDVANWPGSRLDAVLAHERAHLARRDSLTQMLAQIACAIYWPSLLLWLAARSMRRQAEIAADNAVLAGGMRASDYAAELLQLAGQSLRLPALAMAAPSLEARVKSVLSPAVSRSGVRAMDAFKIAWLGSAAAVALAFARPAIAEVQTAPAAPHAQFAPAQSAPIQPAPAAEAPAPDAQPLPTHKPAHHHHRVAIMIDGQGDGEKLSDADKAKIDAAVAQANASMAAVGPEIERAIRQAHVDQAAARSVQQAMPQIHAAVAQAMAQIEPAIHQALVNAKIDAQVSVALDRAQVKIDAAMARVVRVHPRISVDVKVQPQPPDPPDRALDESNP